MEIYVKVNSTKEVTQIFTQLRKDFIPGISDRNVNKRSPSWLYNQKRRRKRKIVFLKT